MTWWCYIAKNNSDLHAFFKLNFPMDYKFGTSRHSKYWWKSNSEIFETVEINHFLDEFTNLLCTRSCSSLTDDDVFTLNLLDADCELI